MKKIELTIPGIGLIAATRGMLGAGIALLLESRIGFPRKTVAWGLFLTGALSTIPLVLLVRARGRSLSPLHRLAAAL